MTKKLKYKHYATHSSSKVRPAKQLSIAKTMADNLMSLTCGYLHNIYTISTQYLHNIYTRLTAVTAYSQCWQCCLCTSQLVVTNLVSVSSLGCVIQQLSSSSPIQISRYLDIYRSRSGIVANSHLITRVGPQPRFLVRAGRHFDTLIRHSGADQNLAI